MILVEDENVTWYAKDYIKLKIIPYMEGIHIQCLCDVVYNTEQHLATFLTKNKVLGKLNQNVWRHSPMFVKYCKANVCHDTFGKNVV